MVSDMNSSSNNPVSRKLLLLVCALLIGALIVSGATREIDELLSDIPLNRSDPVSVIDLKVGALLPADPSDYTGVFYHVGKLASFQWFQARYAAAPVLMVRKQIKGPLPTPGDERCPTGIALKYGVVCFVEKAGR